MIKQERHTVKKQYQFGLLIIFLTGAFGADVDATLDYHATTGGCGFTNPGNDNLQPIHLAAKNGCTELVAYLIDNGADADAVDSLGLRAVDYGQAFPDVIRLLGASNRRGGIYDAAWEGDLQKVKDLVLAGVDINAKFVRDWETLGYGCISLAHCGGTPIHFAVERGRKEIVEYLVGEGADIRVIDYQRMEPIHYAVYFGFKDIIEYLIAHGADVNVIYDYGRRPIDHAVERGNKEIVEWLLENGAVIDESVAAFLVSQELNNQLSDEKEEL